MFSYIYLVLFLFGATTSFKTSSIARNRLYTLANTPRETNQSLKKALKEQKTLWGTLTSKVIDGVKLYIINRATKNGIPWKEYYDLGATNMDILFKNYFDINNPSIVYPSYYLQEFHHYAEGNLNWEAALEAIATTISITTTYWPQVDAITSQSWVRGNITDSIKKHIINSGYSTQDTGKIMDIGCSVGMSTKSLIEAFPDKTVVDAVDLSPHFLSAAKFYHTTPTSPIFTTLHDKISYHHMMAEDMSFASNSYDIISITYLLHELPTKIVEEIIAEAYRVLRPGGTLSIMDANENRVRNNPQPRKYLFELSEPNLREYYNTDPIKIMANTGFTLIESNANDPRNTLWIGSKPDKTTEVKTMTDLEWEELFQEVHKFH